MNMTTRKVSQSVKGTDLKVDDILLVSWPKGKRIVSCVPGQHPLGAKYHDVTLDDGEKMRCWEGFNYHIEVDEQITMRNATPRELSEIGFCPACNKSGKMGYGCPTCPGFWFTDQ